MSDILVVLVIVLVAVLLLRGPKMLPRLGEALGRGIKETRQEVAKGLGRDAEDPSQPSSDQS